jgi:hypothetical protein
VVEAEGFTETIAGSTEEENACPLERVPLHGPLPVRAILSDELLPAQISVEPESEAVGRGMVVTATLELVAAGHVPLDETKR